MSPMQGSLVTVLSEKPGLDELGSERLPGVTLDRLTHRCRIIEVKGASYRPLDMKGRTQARNVAGAMATTKDSQAVS